MLSGPILQSERMRFALAEPPQSAQHWAAHNKFGSATAAFVLHSAIHTEVGLCCNLGALRWRGRHRVRRARLVTDARAGGASRNCARYRRPRHANVRKNLYYI